jgi:hypothetical protein
LASSRSARRRKTSIYRYFFFYYDSHTDAPNPGRAVLRSKESDPANYTSRTGVGDGG